MSPVEMQKTKKKKANSVLKSGFERKSTLKIVLPFQQWYLDASLKVWEQMVTFSVSPSALNNDVRMRQILIAWYLHLL